MDVEVIAVVMLFGIPMVAIIGGIFLQALKILKGESGKENKKIRSEETRIMQEIYHGLTKMDKRIDSLETLMMDKMKEKE